MSRAAVLIVALILVFCNSVQLHGQGDDLLPAYEAAATCSVPAGFSVTAFAQEPEILQPIGFCMDDRARLFVAEAYSYPVHTKDKARDRIVILEDSDGDGVHDNRKVFYEGLNYITGIEYGFGGVWVMSPPYFYFIPDRDGDDRPDGPPELLLDGFGNHANSHNLANGFAWGPDGWLYGTHGRTNWSMIGKPGCAPEERKRFDGGVYRYHPIEHIWEPYADGTTNPWGIDWNDYGHAFITNCVNPHLFQVIQGAHYEPWRGRKSSQYAYQRIDTIADHLHFTGLSNIRSGIGSELEDDAGGGHAHCGTMIYLGDSFPASYRNTLFTNNVHGRRINRDLPRRAGSGYVASHATDLFRASDPWFMGVTLLYGPSGEVYVSDWSDTGECHSTRNTRKHTGRIYRIQYGENTIPSVDLSELSNGELAKLQMHDNDWFVRHSRRLLQERHASGADLSNVHNQMLDQFATARDIPKKLRALWLLYATGGLTDKFLHECLEHKNENIRSWAVTFLCDRNQPSKEILDHFVELASHNASALVRLSLASALQRINLNDRWEILSALASRSEDNEDQNLPLMIWYAAEPLIQVDTSRFVSLGAQSSLRRLRTNVARRVADSEYAQSGLGMLVSQLTPEIDDQVTEDLLSGVLQGLEGRRGLKMPEEWPSVFHRLSQSDNPKLQNQAIRLAVIFKDQSALRQLRGIASNPKEPPTKRNLAIDTLVDQRLRGFERDLLGLINDESVRSSVLRGLAAYQSTETPAVILASYNSMQPEDRQLAQLTLASRATWASELLTAVEEDRIEASEISAYCARQIRSLDDKKLSARLTEQWGGVRETSADKQRQIQRIKKWLSDKELDRANLKAGKQLFVQHCQNCHRLFDEGGTVGPDITGAQRHNLDYMLENVVDPNAAVAKDYQIEIILTDGGRTVTGIVIAEDNQVVTVQTATERVSLAQDDIERRKKSPLSIMPEGLLTPLSEQQIRDLFGYLRSR